jgi:hypothetical protein
MDEELKSYLASGQADGHFQLLRGAIRKGTWDYPEEKLESELKSVKWLQAKKNALLLYAASFVGFLVAIGSAVGPALRDRPIELIPFLMGTVSCAVPFALKPMVASNAKRFLAHVRKLEGGGIKP